MFCHDKEGVCTVPALILFQPQCQLSPMKLIHKRIEEKLLCINRTSVPYQTAVIRQLRLFCRLNPLQWKIRKSVIEYPECSRVPPEAPDRDRKSTRLNSSHVAISYAVFC